MIDCFDFSGGVFTDRDEGTESQSMESIFKYAIFHYNRLAKEAHNLSFKRRIKEETLSLIAAESAVQTVQDGILKLLCTILSLTQSLLLSLFSGATTPCTRYIWSTLSRTSNTCSFNMLSCGYTIHQCMLIML